MFTKCWICLSLKHKDWTTQWVLQVQEIKRLKFFYITTWKSHLRIFISSKLEWLIWPALFQLIVYSTGRKYKSTYEYKVPVYYKKNHRKMTKEVNLCRNNCCSLQFRIIHIKMFKLKKNIVQWEKNHRVQ